MDELIDYKAMIAELNDDEGRKRFAYKDSLGYWTIGVGRLIDERKGGGLSEDEIDYLLHNNIAHALHAIQDTPWFKACDTDARRRAMVSMYFQLENHIFGFKNSLAAIARQDWKTAGRYLRNSLWAKQTPNRAAKIIAMLESGR